jgi:uncharacterized membrane protein YhaH (DUF805 family)
MATFFQDFYQNIKLGFKRYIQFSGESTRMEFAHWMLFAFFTWIFLTDLSIILFIPTISVSIRRLRAVGKPFWWVFFFPALLYFGLKSPANEQLVSQIEDLSTSEDVEVEKALDLQADEEVEVEKVLNLEAEISELKSVFEELSENSDDDELDEARSKVFNAAANLAAIAGFGDSGKKSDMNRDSCKAVMWSGIMVGVLCDGSGEAEVDGSVMNAFDLLRMAVKGFDLLGEQKMSGRASEELGQLGRLLANEGIQMEGFESAIQRFRKSGDSARLNQAMKNSGEEFLRASSSFFDGSKPSLRCTTILGSFQALKIRSLFKLS